jgi:hypothetical protein
MERPTDNSTVESLADVRCSSTGLPASTSGALEMGETNTLSSVTTTARLLE